MVTRKMENYGSARNCASVIVSECISSGRSKGWQCWDLAFFEEVERICSAHGVAYVSDWDGEFAVNKE